MRLPSTMTPIVTYTATSNISELTLSSIPGTYTDLILIVSGPAQAAGGGSVLIQLNGDTGTNYSLNYMFGNGSSVTGGRITNSSYLFTGRQLPTEGNGITHFMNYSNTTTHKTVLSRGGVTTAIVIALANLWRNTAAITSMRFLPESGPGFATGFTATLYGVKAA